MKRLTLPAAAAVVLAANAFVLAKVARNRSGAPDARVELTQKQLPLSPGNDENSGVFVRLATGQSRGQGRYSWLDAAKLAELGYTAPRGWRVPPRPVFVALELDPAQPQLEIVDAGRDPAALRRRHPDRGRFLIAPAVLRSVWRRPEGDYSAHFDLETRQIHVPPPCSAAIVRVPQIYRLTVNYGRNYEPWISGCRAGN